jgi:formamidopyrimidine-DNA glycosylase
LFIVHSKKGTAGAIHKSINSMPELPEVEAARKFLAIFCNGKRIHQVITREQGNGPRHGLFDNVLFDQKISENVIACYKKVPTISIGKNVEKTILKRSKSTPAITESSLPDPEEVEKVYQQLLTNKYIEAVKRKGKQIWFELADTLPSSSSFSSPTPKLKKMRSSKIQTELTIESPTNNKLGLLMHFGMTGGIVIKDKYQATYMSQRTKQTDWPPKFTKMELILKDPNVSSEEEIRVALTDPRRFGDIKLRLNPTSCPPLSSLGYDPSTDTLPSLPELYSLFHKERINIKTLLLNQEKIFCGIGNYLVDEILYQAKIHPLTNANEINEQGIRTMIEKMNEIIQLAINCDGNYKFFPKDWLFHYRWSKKKGVNISDKKLPNGNSIVFETINTRTTAIVPAEQLKNGYYKIKNGNTNDTLNEAEMESKKIVQKKKRKYPVLEDVEKCETEPQVVMVVKSPKRQKSVPQTLSESIKIDIGVDTNNEKNTLLRRSSRKLASEIIGV